MQKNIWVLSGGGAKGCFQAGAIQYLARKNAMYKPHSIAGTSVGALNSLLPAQGWEMPFQNIEDLMGVWLGLEDVSDMYELSEEGKAMNEDRFNDTILASASLNIASFANFMIGGKYAPEETEFEGYTIEFYEGERLAASKARRKQRRRRTGVAARIFAEIFLPGKALGAIILGQTTLQTKHMVEDLGKIKSFFTLRPLENLIRNHLDYSAFSRNRNCYLKLVSTSINNKRMGYMTRNGSYFQVGYQTPGPIPFSNNVSINPISRRGTDSDYHRGIDRIISGTLASAAIPGAFPPVLINGHICFDGGVTDTLPTRAVLNDISGYKSRGHDVRVICIRCNPNQKSLGMGPLLSIVPRGRPSDLERKSILLTKQASDEKSLLDYMGGLVASLSNEVDRSDYFELSQFGDEIEKFDISPTFNINGTAQVDPGLIRIQLTYGWMRAFDVMEGTPASALLTDKIILSRLHAWRLEELSSAVPLTNGIDRIFVPAAIPKIRQMKVLVHDYTEERIASFGRESMPRHRNKHFAYDATWFNAFEKHVWQTSRTPWNHWVDWQSKVVPSDTPPW